MSLINEALRRARLEATRKEALTKGTPVPPLDLEPQAHGRSGSLAILIVAGTALGVALVAGGALFLSGFWGAGSATAAIQADESPAVAAEPSPVAGAPLSAAPEPESSASPDESPVALTTSTKPQPTEVAEATARPATASSVVPPQETSSSRREMASQEAPVAEPDEVRLSEPAPPEAVAETASALSFIHRAELPGGVSIELGGIAWSEARPFALINRQVVGPGESVDGHAVVGIAPGQVELEVDGRTVYIRLK